MAHTRGPWEGRWVSSGMPIGCVKFGVIGPDGLEVARVWRQEDIPLIAAAPEMLDMLKEIAAKTSCVCRLLGYVGKKPPCDACRVNALIAKAEGREG